MKKFYLLFIVVLVTGNLFAQTYNYSNKFAVDFDVMGQDQEWYLNVIEANEAWDLTRGRSDVIIAYVCGSGVNWEHEDLGQDSDNFDNLNRGNSNLELWPTWNVPDDDGSDSDGNGYEDDWRGVVFYSNGVITTDYTNDTRPFEPAIYHGTWIAGIMSAKNIGSIGINGIAGGTQDGLGNSLLISATENLIHEWFYIDEAIEYAVNNGAKVIVLDAIISYTQFVMPIDIRDALDYAFEAGCFVIAPSGWSGTSTLCFPSSYINLNSLNVPVRSVFSVGASTEPNINGNEYRHTNSNYNLGHFFQSYTQSELDLVAPGEHIYTTGNDGDDDYVYIKGTTPAASMVAATVGLMLSVNPDLTYEQIDSILHVTAEKIGKGDYYEYVNGWNENTGYGRLNTHRAVCAALAEAEALTVINGDTWSEPVYSLTSIEVPEDYTLTIESTVYFGPDAAFIIKPGATVTIDGGKLTNYPFCGYSDDMWLGVEVWGDASIHQYVCNGIQHQGKIIIMNGGTIENAETGVLLGARDVNSEGGFLDEKAGGIIQVPYGGNHQVYDANFINNKRAVRFWDYQNYTYDPSNCLNNRPTANLSHFKNCYFNINADYLGGDWYYAHVHLYAVDGINFYGCVFENNKSTDPMGHGINAYASGFRVEHICTSQQSPCPLESQVRSTFTNFGKAVNSSSSGIYTATIKNTDFVDNSRGVVLSRVNNATVLFSDFYLGKPTDCGLEKDAAIGIDMYNCTGFAIEENYFTKGAGNPSGYYVGIRCKDSHTQYDIIYNNTFEGLSYGNFAEGKNRPGPDNDWEGLEYRCNHNSNNSVDFQVDTDDPINSPAMIRGYMGYSNISAGNTFSQQSGVDWHFLNLGTQQVNYWWHEGNPTEEPLYYCILPPDPNPYPDPCMFFPQEPLETENTCPSHYGGGGGSGTDGKSVLLTPGQFQETEQEYLTALNDFNNVKTLYDNLQDGGNTQMLNSEVENAFPSDMWQLRTELLGVSPHVSKEVLMTTAEKTDVFPESVLFEILSANPDELKNGDMISFLENKEDPLPQYMIDMLKQIAEGVTYKTILKRQMADFHAKKSKAAQDIVRSILADSIMEMQLYRNWLDNLGGINADKQIIASYIQEDDYTSAQSLLDIIPSLYELQGNRLNEYNDYKSLTGFLMNIEQQNRNVMELDSNETSYLVDLADNSTGSAKVMARDILNFGFGYNYCDCMPVDSSAMKSSKIDFDKPATETGLGISAKPNPADSWVAFEFRLPSYIGKAVLRITDIEGREIARFPIDSEKGQKVWDIRKVDSGVYFYTLDAGDIQKTDKLIIK